MTSPVSELYATRIGYHGAQAPTLAVLASVPALHLRAIPFENLDPLLGRDVNISAAVVVEKLLKRRRGGYCFEHNSLLHDVLAAWGFQTTPLAARVIWMQPAHAPLSGRTHRLTRVDLPEGPFIVDVGFGGQSPTAPLRLENEVAQVTSHGTYRFMSRDSVVELQMQTPDGWSGMYRFTLEPQVQADFELGNWFTSAHPQSLFRHNLMASIVKNDRRYNLMNRQLSIRDANNRVEEHTLADADAFAALLTGTFGIDLPADAVTIWQRVPA